MGNILGHVGEEGLTGSSMRLVCRGLVRKVFRGSGLELKGTYW